MNIKIGDVLVVIDNDKRKIPKHFYAIGTIVIATDNPRLMDGVGRVVEVKSISHTYGQKICLENLTPLSNNSAEFVRLLYGE